MPSTLELDIIIFIYIKLFLKMRDSKFVGFFLTVLENRGNAKWKAECAKRGPRGEARMFCASGVMYFLP